MLGPSWQLLRGSYVDDAGAEVRGCRDSVIPREVAVSEQVAMGATLMCSMGSSPCSLIVLPANKVNNNSGSTPSANVDDYKITNIPTFGTCQSLSNPTVASATAAANGVLTPMPCVPNIQAPWTPGSLKVTIGRRPALLKSDTCTCLWAGTITVTAPGQMIVQGT
jgi:hypothetical protein